jgi:hypothetical protein
MDPGGLDELLEPILPVSLSMLEDFRDYLDEVGDDINLHLYIIPISAVCEPPKRFNDEDDIYNIYSSIELFIYMYNRHVRVRIDSYLEALRKKHIETIWGVDIFHSLSEMLSDLKRVNVVFAGYRDTQTDEFVLVGL